MKTTMLLTVLLPTLTLAMPLSLSGLTSFVTRQTAALNQATDTLLFSTTLENFITARNAKNPAGLDWTSDGCSDSPDNPFGFPFLPACYRHDFGYRNYKIQSRFTDANKAKIDSNFKSDLYHQCQGQKHDTTCRDTADVYYAAVREFGKKKREALEAEAEVEVETEME